eukprot:1535661-Prymnesium_polylepis.2
MWKTSTAFALPAITSSECSRLIARHSSEQSPTSGCHGNGLGCGSELKAWAGSSRWCRSWRACALLWAVPPISHVSRGISPGLAENAAMRPLVWTSPRSETCEAQNVPLNVPKSTHKSFGGPMSSML